MERGDLWVKTDQGWTFEGEEDEVGYAEEFAELLDQFGPDDLTAWWATRAEYHQAHRSALPARTWRRDPRTTPRGRRKQTLASSRINNAPQAPYIR